jgi:hypothetical protein
MLSLGNCNHTFITDRNNNNLGQADISSVAPGAARTLQIEQFPPDLQVLINNWVSLPNSLRAAIMLIVETGKNSDSD